ncbi:MAG: hypothetical protein OJF61_002108 [Rhodanobacteraceae bacterium]|nr:MAG: hypothetical protein OJF61_002108 [Rhodanobacteraceae bacterium]
MKTPMLITTSMLLILASLAARADDDACQKIRAANIKTGSHGAQLKMTGYGFAQDTPKLYAFGDHACAYLRDETVDGQAAAVYREQYKGSSGSTTATIWISRSSGRLLREEQDGDITGKGKGHISYRWSSTP